MEHIDNQTGNNDNTHSIIDKKKKKTKNKKNLPPPPVFCKKHSASCVTHILYTGTTPRQQEVQAFYGLGSVRGRRSRSSRDNGLLVASCSSWFDKVLHGEEWLEETQAQPLVGKSITPRRAWSFGWSWSVDCQVHCMFITYLRMYCMWLFSSGLLETPAYITHLKAKDK